MTRSLIVTISALCLLIIANTTYFSFLIFNDLSEAMVTEDLARGLREAGESLSNECSPGPESPEQACRDLSRRLGPQLAQKRVFNALIIYNERGQILHRETFSEHFSVAIEQRSDLSGIAAMTPTAPDSRGYSNDATTGRFVRDPHLRQGRSRLLPIQTPPDALPGDTQLALELDPSQIELEVRALRQELNRKLAIAIGLSLLLMLAGVGYVIVAYKRGKLLQQRASRADRMAYVGTLASGLAHEIRNPLNSMNMNVQLIQEELHESKTHMPAEMSEMLEATHKEILRLERLVSSFLAFARPTQLHTHACQINDLLSDTLEFLDPEIERSGISLITRFDPKLPEVSIDESQIKQALLNIIQNAIQVLRPEKQLEVTTRKANGDGVEICIRDEGPGISAHELKNVFKVFYSTRKGGTGLGLPIAQHIVELHDGNIEVESQIGKGSVFTMFLPRKAKPA